MLERFRKYSEQPPVERDYSPIEELEKPIGAILEQLRPGIENGTYVLLLGEDASGRIPTLIMREALGAIYASKGFDTPLCRFVSGSSVSSFESVSEEKQEGLREYMATIKSELGSRLDNGRILVVTDSIFTGQSIRVLADALRECGIPADFATAGYVGPRGIGAREFGENLGGTLATGSEYVPSIYAKPHLSGVTAKSEELYARRRNTQKESAAESAEAATIVHEARAKAKEIGLRLASRFLNEASR